MYYNIDRLYGLNGRVAGVVRNMYEQGPYHPRPSPEWRHEILSVQGKYIDTVIETLYDSVCASAGCEGHGDQMLALFLPGARIMRADVSEEGSYLSALLDVKGFMASMAGSPRQKERYWRETIRRTEMSGNLAKAVSVYEGCLKQDDPEPFRRGTIEMRLYNDGQRWWIVNMLLREYRPEDLLSGMK